MEYVYSAVSPNDMTEVYHDHSSFRGVCRFSISLRLYRTWRQQRRGLDRIGRGHDDPSGIRRIQRLSVESGPLGFRPVAGWVSVLLVLLRRVAKRL